MTYNDQQKYWIWLSSVTGIGSVHFRQLMDAYGEPERVWEQLILAKKVLTPSVYKNLVDARTPAYMDDLFGRMEQYGVTAVTQEDELYPERLRFIANAPLTLFVRGCPDALSSDKTIGIVGSRKVTADGSRFTRTIARHLSENGVTVISGLALGADRQAHIGCLEGGAPTVAVLACGPEVIYPRENEDVAERILEEGGALVSEYRPGIKPATHHFPIRNRIISGLSDGILMTEGGRNSGAMITMRYALQQGRPRFTTPGSVFSAACEGTNQLLVDGALCCISVDQLMDYFHWSKNIDPVTHTSDVIASLDETSKHILEILQFEEKSFDELANIMKITPSVLNSLLTILEMQGIIRQSPGKLYRAIV